MQPRLKGCPLCERPAKVSYHETDDRYPHNRWQVSISCRMGFHDVSVCRFSEFKADALEKAAREWNDRRPTGGTCDH